jgi:hypothetical protein
MAFINIAGFEAKIFIPDDVPGIRKHNCKDCYICQMCSDERCKACLKSHCKSEFTEECEMPS